MHKSRDILKIECRYYIFFSFRKRLLFLRYAKVKVLMWKPLNFSVCSSYFSLSGDLMWSFSLKISLKILFHFRYTYPFPLFSTLQFERQLLQNLIIFSKQGQVLELKKYSKFRFSENYVHNCYYSNQHSQDQEKLSSVDFDLNPYKWQYENLKTT